MNALPVFIWVGTIYFIAVTFLPFIPNRPEFQYHWGFRLVAAILAGLGVWLICTNHTLLH